MGTRNLTCVYKNGEYKVAKYCQWDGYPEGQGVKILNFLKYEMDRDLFEQKLDKVSNISEEENIKLWEGIGINLKDNDGFVTYEEGEKFSKIYPELSRDIGGEILSIIQNSNKDIKLFNDIEFAGDSLFCEWAYVIDLDKNTFEIYEGFNKTPLSPTERFYNFPKHNKYYPVKCIFCYDLDKLPSEKLFLARFEILMEN